MQEINYNLFSFSFSKRSIDYHQCSIYNCPLKYSNCNLTPVCYLFGMMIKITMTWDSLKVPDAVFMVYEVPLLLILSSLRIVYSQASVLPHDLELITCIL